MARKKGTPQRAPEYKTPGNAKDGSKCYTRPTKSGGSYVTCEGTQDTGRAVRSGPPPKGVKKGTAKRTGGAPGAITKAKQQRLDDRKALLRRGLAVKAAKDKAKAEVPKGSHRMPDGKIMKDKDMPKGSFNVKNTKAASVKGSRKKDIDDRFDRELAALDRADNEIEYDKAVADMRAFAATNPLNRVRKAEFDKAVSDMRAFAATNPIGRGGNASLPYQSLSIQLLQTQTAMDKSNENQAELSSYFD